MSREFAIHRFWTIYKPDPSDPAKQIGVDMVSYGPVGQHDRTVNVAEVNRLRRLQPLEGSSNPAVIAAHERWGIIEKYYNAWKANQDVPVDGTPLAAWNALTEEQATLLRTSGVKTVEDVAQMGDAQISRFPFPNMRDLVKQAKMFIESADQTRFAAQMAQKDDEIAALRAGREESDDLMRMLSEEMKAQKAELEKLKAERSQTEKKSKAA